MSASRDSSPATLQETLAQAVVHHQNGRLAEARPLYERVLRQMPDQSDALHLLGLLTAQTGDPESGIALIRKAVAQDGAQPVFRLNLGRVLEAVGRWAEAADAYGHAARLAPLIPDHHRLEAVAQTKLGRAEAAARAFRRLLAVAPEDGEAVNALADALYDLGRPGPAADWYGRASALAPGDVLPAYNQGAALRDAGRPRDALAAFRRAAVLAPLLVQAQEQVTGLCHALGDRAGVAEAGRRLMALEPGHGEGAKILGAALAAAEPWREGAAWLERAAVLAPAPDALLVLGNLWQERGHPAASPRCYRRALALAPDSATALTGLGMALSALGAMEEAATAARRAVRADPEEAGHALNAGAVQHRAKRPEEARAWFRRAVALQPDGAAGWTNLGTHAIDAGAFDEALTLLRRALALRAAEREALASSNLGVALMALGRHGEAVAALRAALDRAPLDAEVRSNLLFCLCFAEEADLGAVFEEHRRFERAVTPVPPAAPRFDAVNRDPERRLRVGYLSPDFQRYPGPGYHFLLPLIERHDRAAVEVTCYYADLPKDAATVRFAALADRWCPVAALPDGELERLIRADGIDVLVDCGGHMSRNRMPLFIRRPAPVQVSLPLYPNTTGLTAMDYQFSDHRFAAASADALHTEKLIRLPGSVLCYRPAESAVAPSVRPPVETAGVFTFGSFNNLTKLNASTLALWGRVLAAVPEARLMLKWRGLSGGGVARRVLDAFAAHGVAESRLLLRGTAPDPYEDYRLLDCALDPVFANGGTTTCDALWMGVPVLSIAGEAMISRWGATMLGSVGLGGLVVEREDDYVALAVRLATDRAFLEAQRAGLRERMARSPLMDEAGYVRAVEAGYRLAWRRWCAGLPPARIDMSVA